MSKFSTTLNKTISLILMLNSAQAFGEWYLTQQQQRRNGQSNLYIYKWRDYKYGAIVEQLPIRNNKINLV
jgi:hypothetical protein